MAVTAIKRKEEMNNEGGQEEIMRHFNHIDACAYGKNNTNKQRKRCLTSVLNKEYPSNLLRCC